MKKLAALVLILMMAAGHAFADLDLSGMSFDELLDLRNKVNQALMMSEEYQEVEVPAGVWKIGEEIPAGHWTVAVRPKDYTQIYYCRELDETGMFESFDAPHQSYMLFGAESSFKDEGPDQVDIEMKAGWYFITTVPVIFKTFTGKPDLGFR